uniref:Uncharacterized protein n=1 Tax=Clastoptera arizonana TaxID=38151 RepID=A0A1B6CGG5_9HEMI
MRLRQKLSLELHLNSSMWGFFSPYVSVLENINIIPCELSKKNNQWTICYNCKTKLRSYNIITGVKGLHFLQLVRVETLIIQDSPSMRRRYQDAALKAFSHTVFRSLLYRIYDALSYLKLS